MKFTTSAHNDKFWHNDKGQFHNIIEPAMVYADGSEFWQRNDLPHRLDGPAIIYSEGIQYWVWLGNIYILKNTILLSLT